MYCSYTVCNKIDGSPWYCHHSEGVVGHLVGHAMPQGDLCGTESSHQAGNNNDNNNNNRVVIIKIIVI